MATFDTTSSRFLRPHDAGRMRRNQRQIQVQRVLVVARNFIVFAVVVVAAVWTYRETQSDARFAVKKIEVEGVTHTPAAAIDRITSQYVGLNLFKIDIARVQRDLGGLAWVSRIEIEKQLPGTLRIRVTERQPVALLSRGDRLLYIDSTSTPFAELSPTVGDDDLPIISGATGSELRRAVAFVRELRAKDPQVYSRISEVRPIAPRGFALFDRELGAFVYANAEDVSGKWRSLYSIARAEHLGRGDIRYADLRFAGRVVLRPNVTLEQTITAKPLASEGVTHVQN
jgi:cell division protein FtsQ